jgi:iron(III) transport system substrate-binding protein
MLQAKFPDYEIVFEYMGLSELAAKLENEGADTDIDIALDLGYVYLEKMAQQNMFMDHRVFADIMQEQFEELFWINDGSYMPWGPYSGCVAVNMDVLDAKGLTAPTSWEDLLDPKYVDLIEMPNPASSGTGYIFYLMLAHHMGDDAAVEYFTKLSDNVLEFTSSGSAPLKALVAGEVGIALCMTYQAALQMDEGVNLKILSFDGGYPWTSDGAAIVKGHNTEAVKDVFRYLYSDEVLLADAQLMPEHGLAGVETTIQNWPSDLTYAEMGEDTLAEKERLLAIWPF